MRTTFSLLTYRLNGRPLYGECGKVCFSMNRMVFFSARFSLTPALSRWARENCWQMVCNGEECSKFGHKILRPCITDRVLGGRGEMTHGQGAWCRWSDVSDISDGSYFQPSSGIFNSRCHNCYRSADGFTFQPLRVISGWLLAPVAESGRPSWKSIRNLRVSPGNNEM